MHEKPGDDKRCLEGYRAEAADLREELAILRHQVAHLADLRHQNVVLRGRLSETESLLSGARSELDGLRRQLAEANATIDRLNGICRAKGVLDGQGEIDAWEADKALVEKLQHKVNILEPENAALREKLRLAEMQNADHGAAVTSLEADLAERRRDALDSQAALDEANNEVIRLREMNAELCLELSEIKRLRADH